jgi:hypothetical protein
MVRGIVMGRLGTSKLLVGLPVFRKPVPDRPVPLGASRAGQAARGITPKGG